MAVESAAGYPWNGWPNQRGISGRMAVESVAEWAWNTQWLAAGDADAETEFGRKGNENAVTETAGGKGVRIVACMAGFDREKIGLAVDRFGEYCGPEKGDMGAGNTISAKL